MYVRFWIRPLALAHPSRFQKQVEEASGEVSELETKHDKAQEESQKIKGSRDQTVQEMLSKRRELKRLNVSVIVGLH
jgi:hypothetical protein